MVGFEDEEPNSLAFQEQLTDRFLEKVIEHLGGNCQIESLVRFAFFENVVVQIQSRPAGLVDRRAIPRLRDSFARGARGLDPRLLSFFQLGQRLPRSVAKGRAKAQVRDVGNVAFVFLAIENIDVKIFYDS